MHGGMGAGVGVVPQSAGDPEACSLVEQDGGGSDIAPKQPGTTIRSVGNHGFEELRADTAAA